MVLNETPPRLRQPPPLELNEPAYIVDQVHETDPGPYTAEFQREPN
jgi:hypothetical protein